MNLNHRFPRFLLAGALSIGALSTGLLFAQAPRPQVVLPPNPSTVTPTTDPIRDGQQAPAFTLPPSSVIMTTLRIPVVGGGVLDLNDIGNGFYPNIPHTSLNSKDLADVMLWMESKGAPRPIAVVVDLLSDSRTTRSGPAYFLYSYKDPQGVPTLYVHDALQTFVAPHVTLTELKNEFHFGNPSVFEYYISPLPPVAFVVANPIGQPWPDKCPVCFRPSDADRDGKFKEGDKYVDGTGTYIRFQEWTAFFPHAVWRKQ